MLFFFSDDLEQEILPGDKMVHVDIYLGTLCTFHQQTVNIYNRPYIIQVCLTCFFCLIFWTRDSAWHEWNILIYYCECCQPQDTRVTDSLFLCHCDHLKLFFYVTFSSCIQNNFKVSRILNKHKAEQKRVAVSLKGLRVTFLAFYLL